MVRRVDDNKPMMPSTPAYHRPFPKREKWAGPTEYGKSIARDIRKRIAEMGERRPDRSWAPKVLARAAAGEPICLHIQDIARDVVERGGGREPGEDDE